MDGFWREFQTWKSWEEGCHTSVRVIRAGPWKSLQGASDSHGRLRRTYGLKFWRWRGHLVSGTPAIVLRGPSPGLASLAPNKPVAKAIMLTSWQHHKDSVAERSKAGQTGRQEPRERETADSWLAKQTDRQQTSPHLHIFPNLTSYIFTSWHLLIFTSSHTPSHLLIFTLLIFTSSHLHTF